MKSLLLAFFNPRLFFLQKQTFIHESLLKGVDLIEAAQGILSKWFAIFV